MKKFRFALALVLAGALLLLPACASAQRIRVVDPWVPIAQRQDIYKELVQLEAQGKTQEALARIEVTLAANPDIDSAYAIAVYLTQRTFDLTDQRRLNNRSFLLYADAFFYIASATTIKGFQRVLLQNVMAGIMTFEVLATSDSLRCQDRSGWTNYKSAVLYPHLKKLEPAYFAFSVPEYKKLIDETLTYENIHLGRPTNAGLCGPAASDTPVAADKEDSSVFVSPYTWANNRKSVHETLAGFWAKRYQEATKIEVK